MRKTERRARRFSMTWVPFIGHRPVGGGKLWANQMTCVPDELRLKKGMNRRKFLQTSATAALALSALPDYAAEFGDMKKRVGLIGCGWYGKCDLFRLIQVAPVEVVSLCDVDKRMLAEAADMVATRQVSKKKPRTYGDYRQMLKEKDLDLVLIETPDHWHALPMIEACRSGIDVWVQKPISVDIAEGQA